MPVHPHSGIATVTVFTEGDVTFDDPQAGHGTIGYGGVELRVPERACGTARNFQPATSPTVQGFQLWLALPPDLETAEPEAQYIGAEGCRAGLGPAPSHRRCLWWGDEPGASAAGRSTIF